VSAASEPWTEFSPIDWACTLRIVFGADRSSAALIELELHRAIGAWASMNGLGGAAGMLFGGIITQELSWRWVLLINPPIGIAAALIAYAVVSERRRAPGRSFDLAGALTLTIGQIVLVFGIVEAGLAGLDTVLVESGIDVAEFLAALHAETAAGFRLSATPGSVPISSRNGS